LLSDVSRFSVLKVLDWVGNAFTELVGVLLLGFEAVSETDELDELDDEPDELSTDKPTWLLVGGLIWLPIRLLFKLVNSFVKLLCS